MDLPTLYDSSSPEVARVTFSDSDSAPVPSFFNPDPVQKIFKFENLTPGQTLALPSMQPKISIFLLNKWHV